MTSSPTILGDSTGPLTQNAQMIARNEDQQALALRCTDGTWVLRMWQMKKWLSFSPF